nr:hypothetical protein [Hoylesella enoeca]
MEIKCPKCRFKYDMYAAPGIRELACVCPRCGTPFTYTIPDDAVRHAGDKVSENSFVDGESQDAEQLNVNHPAINGKSADEKPFSATQKAVNREVTRELSSAEAPQMELTPLGEQSTVEGESPRGGCFKWVILLVIGVLAGVFFAAKSCRNDKSYTAEDIYTNTASAEDSNTSTIVKDSASKDPFTEIHPEKAPDWIQGTWSVDTEFGHITVEIKGDRISETSDGETAHGRFYYEASRLNCDYGDGSIIIYKLDETRRLIDAGDGLFMHRVE